MKDPRPNELRTVWCGELGPADVGEQVTVAGWVHRRRDHGGLIFIDLRDRSGLLQLVFHPETDPELFALAERLRPEHVVSATGELVRRDEANVNPDMPTGKTSGSCCMKRRTALGWSTARPSTCQPRPACSA